MLGLSPDAGKVHRQDLRSDKVQKGREEGRGEHEPNWMSNLKDIARRFWFQTEKSKHRTQNLQIRKCNLAKMPISLNTVVLPDQESFEGG